MKALSIMQYVFFLIGLGLLVGAYYSYSGTQRFISNALTTSGEVVDLIRSRSDDSYVYKPVVQFTALDGSNVEFASNSGSNPPSYARGEVVEVFYLEAEPEKAKINGFFSLWGLAAILGGIGLSFFLIGLSLILTARFKKEKINYLTKRGRSIQTDFQGVNRNTSLKVNGKSPFQISAQWQNPSTGEIHVFESDNIWFDPTDYIVGDEVTVLIDGNNPEKYHMDISFLPKLAD